MAELVRNLMENTEMPALAVSSGLTREKCLEMCIIKSVQPFCTRYDKQKSPMTYESLVCMHTTCIYAHLYCVCMMYV